MRLLYYLRCSESVLVAYYINNHLALPEIDISSHFVRGLGGAVGRLGGYGRTTPW